MNAPQKQPGRRIVSKGTYYFLRVTFGVLGAEGYVLAVLGAVSIVYLFARWHRTLASHPAYTAFMLLACTLAIAAGVFIAKRTNKAMQDMNIIPLTNAGTASLPAPDSLVRASEEPLQKQQAMLLRPAAQCGEAHEEQLLRASLGRDIGA